jgi:hypothetical protein
MTFADQGWGSSEEEVRRNSYAPSVSVCALSIFVPLWTCSLGSTGVEPLIY